jgi:hypothetical protein
MCKRIVWPLLIALAFLPGLAAAQQEVASRYRHYRSTEMATGLYEEYEVRPRNQAGYFKAGERQGLGLSRVEDPGHPGPEPHVSERFPPGPAFLRAAPLCGLPS